MSAEFTPITNIQKSRIRTSVELPYHLETQVGLDIRYLQTMLQIAGIKHINITTDNNGEISKTEIQTVGLNRDGSALAGKQRLWKFHLIHKI